MKEKIELYATAAVGVIASAFLLFVSVKYILPVIMPFIIGWFVAYAVKYPAQRLSASVRISARVLRVILALLSSLLFFSLIYVLLWQTVNVIWDFLSDVGSGENPIYDLIISLAEGNYFFHDSIPEEISDKISEALSNLLSGALGNLAGAVTSLASRLPDVLLFLLVTMISIVYFSWDLEKINTRVRRMLPKSVGSFLLKMRHRLFSLVAKYAGSYLLIMLITFVIMSIGFLILRVKSPFLIGFLVAVLDMLPVIGVGIVLLPWSIGAFAVGNGTLCVGLLVLFGIYTVVRELAEPKIIGKSMGIHPIVSLIIIYAGYALFGLYGLLLTPLIAALLSFLFKEDDTAKIK